MNNTSSNLKNGAISERLKFPIVLCGDVLPHRKLLSDSFSQTVGLTLVRYSEEPQSLFAICERLNAPVLIARQEFIRQVGAVDLRRLMSDNGTHVVAILESDSVDAAIHMLRLGCRGVLPPRFSSKFLRRAVIAILEGEFWAPRRAVSSLLSELLNNGSPDRDKSALTPQEQRILELAVQGFKNSAIASALFISPETVRWHKRRLYRKIGKSGLPTYPQAQAPSRNPGLAAG